MLAFLCHADDQTGLGHLVRCLALGAEAERRGEDIALLLTAPSPRVVSFAEQANVSITEIEDSSSKTVLRSIESLGASQAFVDGYHFSPDVYSALREAVTVVAIDDLADRPLAVHFVVNPNPYARELRYQVEPDTRLLLGLEYALLRREFRRLRRKYGRPSAGPIRRIVVMMGGADFGRGSSKVLGALSDFDGTVLVVVGPAAESRSEVDRLASSLPCDARLVLPDENIPELIAGADLGIIGAGGATWEFAALGVPVLHVVLAENQIKLAEAGESIGLSRSLGHVGSFTGTDLRTELARLDGSTQAREKMSHAGYTAVDGFGAARVLDAVGVSVECPELRIASLDDEQIVWQINNDPSVRSRSISTAPIPWTQHREWFTTVLEAEEEQVWIVEVGGRVSGVVRVNSKEDQSTISIALAPQARGRGLGTKTIGAAARAVMRSNGPAHRVVARIRLDNIESVAAFERAGFRYQRGVLTEGVELLELIFEDRGSS